MTTKATTPKSPPPPKGTGKRAAAFWKETLAAYDLAGSDLVILHELVASMDRVDAAREVLAREGMSIRDRYDQVRPHPAAAIEAQASTRIRSLIAALALPDLPEAGAS